MFLTAPVRTAVSPLLVDDWLARARRSWARVSMLKSSQGIELWVSDKLFIGCSGGGEDAGRLMQAASSSPTGWLLEETFPT